MHLKRITAAILCAVAAALFVIPVHATDVAINPSGPIAGINGLVWGQSAAQGFNNNYWFAPLALNESVCVYVYNNNPSNLHTFTAAITVSANPQNTTPSDGTWQIAANSTGLVATTSPGIPGGIGASISGASIVSINFSGSSVQAGNPDTANVKIVQTPGSCFSGQNFFGSATQTVSAGSPLQAISEGLSQSFSAAVSTINPTGGLNVLFVDDNNSARSLFFDSVTLSTSAATTFTIFEAATAGTCTNFAPANMKMGPSGLSSTALVAGTCSVNPSTNATIAVISLGAGGAQTFDLKGFIAQSSTVTGIEVTTTAVTGTVSATIKWYEK